MVQCQKKKLPYPYQHPCLCVLEVSHNIHVLQSHTRTTYPAILENSNSKHAAGWVLKVFSTHTVSREDATFDPVSLYILGKAHEIGPLCEFHSNEPSHPSVSSSFLLPFLVLYFFSCHKGHRWLPLMNEKTVLPSLLFSGGLKSLFSGIVQVWLKLVQCKLSVISDLSEKKVATSPMVNLYWNSSYNSCDGSMGGLNQIK